MQFVLLATLWWLEREDSSGPTQAELANHAGIDPMMTSQVLRKLEQRGLLERQPSPADSRAQMVRLAASGRSALTGALSDVEAADARYFAALGDAREGFLSGLRTLGSVGLA